MPTTRRSTKKKQRKLVRRTEEGAKAIAESTGGDYDRMYAEPVKTWTPKVPGKYHIRILPPGWGTDEKPPDHYGHKVWVHPSLGPDSRDSYICPRKTVGDPCPICEAMDEAKRTGNGDAKWVKDVKPYQRMLIYILVRKDKEVEGIRLWTAPPSLDRSIVQVSEDPTDGQIIYVDDLEEGHDVFFRREGSGKEGTSYPGAQIAPRPSLACDEEDLEELQDFIMDHPIPDMVIIQPYKYLDQIFNGSAGAPVEEEEEVEEVEEEIQTRTRRGSKAKAEDDNWIDGDSEETEEVEEEETEETDEVEEEVEEKGENTRSRIRSGLRRRKAKDED